MALQLANTCLVETKKKNAKGKCTQCTLSAKKLICNTLEDYSTEEAQSKRKEQTNNELGLPISLFTAGPVDWDVVLLDGT